MILIFIVGGMVAYPVEINGDIHFHIISEIIG